MGPEDETENVKDLILKKIEGASLSSEVCRRDPYANFLVTSGGVNPPTRRSQGGKTCDCMRGFVHVCLHTFVHRVPLFPSLCASIRSLAKQSAVVCMHRPLHQHFSDSHAWPDR